MSSEHPPLIRTRLSIAYLLQFAVWGSWGVLLFGYVAKSSFNFAGWQIGLFGSAIPLGAIISPLFIGPIADKYFSAQKVIAVLHLLSGIFLIALGFVQSFWLMAILLLLFGICYMPTIALVNSVVFKHIPNPDNAPRVFVFGTIGWIAVNVFISAHLGGSDTPNFLFTGGILAITLALYSLTLPDTPPQGADKSGAPFGLDALKLFKDSSFTIFVVCAFLVSIPACGFFFLFQVLILQERGFAYPGGLATVCQFSELIFMAALPFFVKRAGLKIVLIIGMVAWGVRYLLFQSGDFTLVIIALLLHGFCYSFLYVGAYMYADKKAPPELKASVQSLLTFLLLGVGMLLGAQLYGQLSDRNPPAFASMETLDGTVALPGWSDPEEADSKVKYLNPTVTYKAILEAVGVIEPEEAQAAASQDMSGFLSAGQTSLKLSEINSGLTVDDGACTQEELQDVFRDVATWKKSGGLKPGDAGFDGARAGLTEADLTLTRNDWLGAKAKLWKNILLYPAIFIFIITVIFMVLGKNPPVEEEPAEEEMSEEQAEQEKTEEDGGPNPEGAE